MKHFLLFIMCLISSTAFGIGVERVEPANWWVGMKNVTWENPLKPFTIVGHPKQSVENITFTNCYVGGKLMTGLNDAQFQIEFARNIVFVPGGKAVRSRYPEQPE